jgi:SPP1 family predicted phage head-tail adaptor
MSIGARRHLVRLDTPNTPVPDGQGGYTQSWTTLGTAYAEIQPATTATLERLGANTVTANATHTVRMPWRTGVTTTTRVVFGTREFAITGLSNPDERNIDLMLICTERVT